VCFISQKNTLKETPVPLDIERLAKYAGFVGPFILCTAQHQLRCHRDVQPARQFELGIMKEHWREPIGLRIMTLAICSARAPQLVPSRNQVRRILVRLQLDQNFVASIPAPALHNCPPQPGSLSYHPQLNPIHLKAILQFDNVLQATALALPRITAVELFRPVHFQCLSGRHRLHPVTSPNCLRICPSGSIRCWVIEK